MANLESLKKLTLELEDMILEEHESFIEYKPDNGGTFIGFCLHNEPAVAVQRVFMSKETKVAEHTHEENEYCLVYKGKTEISINDDTHVARINGEVSKSRILGVGDAIFFPSGMPHSAVMLEDTWMISVTIPASKSYPKRGE